ncbi:hypothetical protein B0A52_03634 [Exophiala mesophila]|uniref:Uncharacterized protein n=1 Tax=Exophiala mesophila TaxID=212818 RepID=A0A438N9K2_EXOME|nr:hypothetical protein B0A52_03634 [Exophiala mesophila]
MNAIKEALIAEAPLQIPLLSQLGRGALRTFFASPSDVQIHENAVPDLWHKLVSTLKCPQVLDKHLAAAANALCVFLLAGPSTTVSEVKDFVLTRHVWFEAFQCVHKAFNDGKYKPAFQVLDALCDLIQQMDQRQPDYSVLSDAAVPLIKTVLLASPRSEVKKACQFLTCLVRRTKLTAVLPEYVSSALGDNSTVWHRRLAMYSIAPAEIQETGSGQVSSFLLALTISMNDLDTRSSALKLCSTLCGQEKDIPEGLELQSKEETVIKLFLERNYESLGVFAEYVLPAILNDKARLISFVAPYIALARDHDSRVAILLAALRVGRTVNMLSEPESLNILNSAFPRHVDPMANMDDYDCFTLLLASGNPALRISAYNLLTTSSSTTSPLPRSGLNCIISSVPYLHDYSDAHERSEILSVTRKLFNRVQSSFSAAQKLAEREPADQTALEIVSSHSDFVRALFSFYKSELQPHLSYQRHILSLLSLRYFITYPTQRVICENDTMLIRLLVNLAIDAFEDVRNTSTSLLQTLSTSNPVGVAVVLSERFVNLMGALAVMTGRGDHADAMGRLWALRDTLSDKTRNAEVITSPLSSNSQGLILALQETLAQTTTIKPGSLFPLHGTFLALSHRLSRMNPDEYSYQGIDVATVVLECHFLWNQVRPALCVDSPETSSGIEEDDGREGPKDLLAYSWRALRDSSLLLQSLIATAEASESLYSSIGDLCLDQLISLRHRGAFSTVAQTFTQCCARTRASTRPNIKRLIFVWHEVAMKQITEQADRLTRRSAGLPAMFLALLDPADLPFVSTVVVKLMSIAKEPSARTTEGSQRLPQVHALNCLKELATNSRFSTAIIPFNHSMLELAALSMSSTVWAIRNCGLMLLRACINRLEQFDLEEVPTGSDQTSTSDKLDVPSTIALRFLHPRLDDGTEQADGPVLTEENIFAALDLLSHSNPRQASQIDQVVFHHLAHSSWAVRDHAALLLSKRMSSWRLIDVLARFMSELDEFASQNRAHGTILGFKYIFQSSRKGLGEADVMFCWKCIRQIRDWNLVRSPYVEGSLLDVINQMAMLASQHFWTSSAANDLDVGPRASEKSPPQSSHLTYVFRRKLLLEVYQLLFTSPSMSEESCSDIVRRLLIKQDALSYVLDNISQALRDDSILPRVMTALFLAYVVKALQKDSTRSPDSLGAALMTLADSLDVGVGDFPNEIASSLDLVDSSELSTREELIAWIRLEGYLLAARPKMKPQDLRCRSMARWIEALNFAATDFVDFPTRLGAAKALTTYFRLVNDSGALSKDLPHEHRLRLYVVLYNLLNDDDEDIRTVVTEAAYVILAQDLQHPPSLGLSPLFARQQILGLIARIYDCTEGLAKVLLGQLVQPDSSVDEGQVSRILGTSIASKISKIVESKTDLFVEEKQNLYVDDIREIQMWCDILEKSGFDSLEQDDVDLIAQWASEGMDEIVRILRKESLHQRDQNASDEAQNKETAQREPIWSSGHPMGSTYDAEFLAIFIQVIAISGIVLRSQKAAVVGQEMAAKVKSILDICRGNQCNELMLGEVEKALKSR